MAEPPQPAPKTARKSCAQDRPGVGKNDEYRSEQPDQEVLHLMRKKQVMPGGRQRAVEGKYEKHRSGRKQGVPDYSHTLAH